MSTIIAYDLGTGGTKASLYDRDGSCLKSTFVPYETIYPNIGWHEQRPDDWWKAIVESTQKLLSDEEVDKKTIKCLALSGHSLGVVPIDRGGRLLKETTPIWSDTRAKEQARQFFNKVDQDEWYKTTGNGFSRECYSVFKIMYYRDNEPDMFSKIYKIIGTKDYINFKLTGNLMTDFSYASGCGVFNLLDHDYDQNLIDASGLFIELFPDLVPSTHIVGELSKEASEILDLPQKIKVLCGGVDNSCMALGAGNISEGRVYLSLGSSAWIAVSSNKPIIDVNIKPFVFAHVIPNMFTSATGIFSAGSSFSWIRDNICINIKDTAERKGKDPYDEMIKLAKYNSVVGANKLIFNPSLAGGSAAHQTPNIRGAYFGFDLSHTQADMIRAAMEGIAMELSIMFRKLKELSRLENEVLLVGGGSKSAFWRQIFADTFNTQIVKANVDQDAGSLGAAAVAATGAGLWKDFNYIDEIITREDIKKPQTENVNKYKELISIYEHSMRYSAELGDLFSEIELK